MPPYIGVRRGPVNEAAAVCGGVATSHTIQGILSRGVMLRNCAVVLLFVSAFAPLATAQFDLGSIVGIVSDPQKAPVAGATVEIKSVATNVSRTVTTSEAGEYNSLPLPPGKYTVTIRQPGFQTRTTEVNLPVGQRVQVDIGLEVGQVSEQITVQAQAQLLETGSSEISNVRLQKEIVDLPLNTRNFTQLVHLAPGVFRGTGGNSGVLGYTSGRGTNGAVINGSPSEDVVYLIDGIQSVDTDAGVLIFFPTVDSIQEFKVQTSAAPASYGGGQGIINISFKTGSNGVHGTAYEFLRNSALDAKNFFAAPARPNPPFRLNQFGGNLSGPVYIPRLFDGRNKLFFFTDYEGKRSSLSQNYISTVPIDAYRTGDFSSLLPRTVIYDPRTTPRVPFPNNQIPSALIDRTSSNLMALYPKPNLPGAINNFLYTPAQTNRVDQFNVRTDYRTEHSSLFGRYSWEDADTYNPGFLPEPGVGAGPGRPGRVLIPSKQAVIGYGRTLSPTKYYELRVGYSRMYQGIIDALSNRLTMAEELGIPNANGGGVAGGLSSIGITGMVGLGDGAGSLDKINNNWEIDNVFSWVAGRHELKMGFDYMSRRFAFYSPGRPVGQFNFTGVYTNNPASPSGTGFGLADFLLGYPINSRLDVTKYFSLHRFQNSWYIQDNWRVNQRLTLNFGLRNDMVTPWKERHNRLAGFVPTGGGTLVPVGNQPFPGDTIFDRNDWNLGPRLGFALTLSPKTVIRGGGGVFYSFKTVTSGNSPAKNAPFSGTLLVSNNALDASSAKKISAGFPAGRPELWPIQGTGFYYWPSDSRVPTSYQWNLQVQREVFANIVLSVAYVGAKGTFVVAFPNINQPVPGPGAVAPRRPYPNLSDAIGVTPWANSSYNSLQTTFTRRMGSYVTFNGAYTWSHSIDNSSGESSSTPIQNSYNLRAERGNSSFDVRHNFVMSWTMELPFGKGKRWMSNAPAPVQWVTAGWQANAIHTIQSGLPFNVSMQQNTLNIGGGTQYPNRIADGNLPSSQRSIDRWFDASAFVAPAQFQFGNAGRNILYGPGTNQTDLSLFKSFRIGEKAGRGLQFRAEAFNVLNTPQFNNPNASIGFAGVGRITSAGQPTIFQRTSRQIQFALKLYF